MYLTRARMSNMAAPPWLWPFDQNTSYTVLLVCLSSFVFFAYFPCSLPSSLFPCLLLFPFDSFPLLSLSPSLSFYLSSFLFLLPVLRPPIPPPSLPPTLLLSILPPPPLSLSPSLFSLSFFSPSSRVQIQDLIYARHTICHWFLSLSHHTPSITCFVSMHLSLQQFRGLVLLSI